MATPKTPGLVMELRDLSNTLNGWADMFIGTDVFWSQLQTDEPLLFNTFSDRKTYGHDVDMALSTENPTQILLDSGADLIESLRGLLATMLPVYEFLDRFRISASRLFIFPSEEYSLSLERLACSVSRLTPTHLSVQLHASVFGSEYWIRNKATDLERTVYENINKAFYSELLSRRDEYFFDASTENLEKYLVIAEELAKREHPLAALARHEPHIQSSTTRRAQAEELLDSLTVGSLIAPLFVDEPPEPPVVSSP